VVDQGIQRIDKLFRDFYKDDKTAFIFTADHGMSDKGDHYHFIRLNGQEITVMVIL